MISLLSTYFLPSVHVLRRSFALVGASVALCKLAPFGRYKFSPLSIDLLLFSDDRSRVLTHFLRDVRSINPSMLKRFSFAAHYTGAI